MNWELTEERRMLQDSVQRFINDKYDFDTRAAIISSTDGMNNKYWSEFADMGWLALPFSERDGGFGSDLVDLCLLMEEFGRGIIVEPYLSTVVLCGTLVSHLDQSAVRSELIERIIGGETKAALAYTEPHSRYELETANTIATVKAGGFELEGTKTTVLGAPQADVILISANVVDGHSNQNNLSLFLVPCDSDGISLSEYVTIDGRRAADIELKRTFVDADSQLTVAGDTAITLATAVDAACLAMSAEAVGAMKALVEITSEYLNTRVQFGRPIAKFQALQHRLADMYIATVRTESLMQLAAATLPDLSPVERSRIISAVKVQAGKSGMFVGQQAIQLHGGIGVTDELNVGHYFKRLTAIDMLFGNTDHHLKRFVEFV